MHETSGGVTVATQSFMATKLKAGEASRAASEATENRSSEAGRE